MHKRIRSISSRFLLLLLLLLLLQHRERTLLGSNISRMTAMLITTTHRQVGDSFSSVSGLLCLCCRVHIFLSLFDVLV